MAERKTHFHGWREYFTFGEGFPGFGETDDLKSARWNADLFEEAPVSEPENAPVAYTGDEDFPTRGRYSESVSSSTRRGSSTLNLCAAGARGLCQERMRNPCAEVARSLCWSRAPNVRRENPKSVATASSPKSAAPVHNPESAQSVEAKLDLSLFRELYRSRGWASCSSSIVRPAISLPSTHRSSCKLSILGFG